MERSLAERRFRLHGRFRDAETARNLPVAVEITLDLEGWGEIVRLVEIAG